MPNNFAHGRTLRERLLSRLIIDESGCLLWAGSRDRNGYGQIFAGGTMRKVHRVAYALLIGPIPDGLQIDHLCRVRHCAAPAHMEAVTQRVNLLRGETFAAANAAITHCPRQHAYDGANTRRTPSGERVCRACHRESMRRRRADQRAAQ